MTVLTTQGLSKSYGKLKALDGLNLTIEEGQIYGILGPNGSGKTTTLGILLNILKPSQGSFEWFDGQYKTQARRHIGAILETPNFYPYMNASQNLDIVRRTKGLPKQDFDDILEQVNLSERKKSPFRSYSLGMKQRLAIAATLIGDPKVLIFDEPTNGLDPQGIAEVRDILLRVSRSGRAVIMASHILDEVEKICSHVAIIKKGKLLATGPIGAILQDNTIIEIAAADMGKLTDDLRKLSYVTDIDTRNNWIECVIPADVSTASFSSEMYMLGNVPTRLLARKRRLEEEFLEITKQS
ncbi:MAG: ABC transporter ATP-binding protein [Bacteroidota bacterium]